MNVYVKWWGYSSFSFSSMSNTIPPEQYLKSMSVENIKFNSKVGAHQICNGSDNVKIQEHHVKFTKGRLGAYLAYFRKWLAALVIKSLR